MTTWKDAVNVYRGIAVSPGIRMGRAKVIRPKRLEAEATQVEPSQVDAEIQRLSHAVQASIAQLEVLKERIDRKTGENHYFILEAHQLMLRDELFSQEALRLIQEHQFSAEWAVKVVVKRLARRFEAMEGEVFQRRGADVRDVGLRLLEHLHGDFLRGIEDLGLDDLVVARNLSPGDATQFYRHPVQALALEIGGKASHIAIIAHSMEIPAVLGLKGILDHVEDGDQVIVDGNHGALVVNPDPGQMAEYDTMRRAFDLLHARLQRNTLAPSVTSDGVSITLRANIESLEELPQLAHYGAQGVGLFRTEFLFMDRHTPPEEDEHYAVYRTLLEGCPGAPVTIRTADIGSDKLPSYWPSSDDGIPALGMRAIRTIAQNERYFVDQVRAVYRAAVHGQARLLLPFVSGVDELEQVLERIARIRADLLREGVDFDPDVPIGTMIELPSAALVSDFLAESADYFSIGTNDLVQYALAVDRDAEHLSYLYTPLHPAILRLIRLVCDNGRKAGISVALCGEMAAEPRYAPLLIGLGLTELDMTSAAIPYVREIVRRLSAAQARALARDCLSRRTADEVAACVDAFAREHFPELGET